MRLARLPTDDLRRSRYSYHLVRLLWRNRFNALWVIALLLRHIIRAKLSRCA